MTFPQTLPGTAVLRGQDLWRLFTQVESSGDIYESEATGLAFAIGPQSDISCVTLTYFRPDTPQTSEILEVTTDRPHIGRIDARTAQYTTGDRARILVAPDELIPQESFRPRGFTDGDTLVREPILLDFFQYLTEPPALIPQRTDRLHYYQAITFPDAPNQTVWYLLPYYGRRYASITFAAEEGNIDFELTVLGVQIDTGTTLAASNFTPEYLLRGPITVNSTSIHEEIRASTDGMYDILILRVFIDAFPGFPLEGVNLKVRTSDRE